jgi:GT2 family glycosyltransferase/glycosyltransferase involved in cell wall biosynthesis
MSFQTKMTVSNLKTKGKVSIIAQKRAIDISDILRIETKNPEGDAIQAQAVQIEGQECLEVSIGDVSGWVRLQCTGTSKSTVFGMRILLKASAETARHSPKIRAVLAKSKPKTSWREALTETSQYFPIKTSLWMEITGLFACGSQTDGRRVDTLIDLPPNSSFIIAEVDQYQFPASMDATNDRPIMENFVKTIRPFNSNTNSDWTLNNLAKKPITFSTSAQVEGFNVSGHVVASGPLKNVDISTNEVTKKASIVPSHPVQIIDNVWIPCGFQSSLDHFLDAGATEVKVVWTGDEAQLSKTLVLPQKLRLARLHETNKEMHTADADLNSAPVKLFYFPDYTSTNPYQRLMYRNMPEINAKAGDLTNAIQCLENEQSEQRVTLHLHWLNPVLAECKTLEEGDKACDDFLRRLEYFVSLGGIVLWTVHNAISHDGKLFNVEQRLGQGVADLASIIHVHSKRLLPILADFYDIAESRVVVQQHPNFIGYHPDYVSRKIAREHHGYAETDKVFLFCGQLRPYKGIDDLVAAFTEIVRKNPNTHLLIVGKQVFPYSPGFLTQKFKGVKNLRIVEGHVGDADLQWYYKASDWVVLPYKNILTSGSLLCAMSFRQPCIAPKLGMIPDILKSSKSGFTYNLQNPKGLLNAMLAACDTSLEDREIMAEAAQKTVKPLTWSKMGKALTSSIQRAYSTRVVTINFEDKSRDCLLAGPKFPPTEIASTAIIILNYEHIDDVLRLIGTLKNSSSQDFDIYVVDNASPSLSLSQLLLAVPGVHLLRLPENLGYAAGNNAAMRLVKPLGYEFVWILNPDMVVSTTAMQQHRDAAAMYPEASIFGAVIERGDADDRVSSAGCYASFEDGVNTNHMFAGKDVSLLPDEPYLADFVTGASVFLRMSALDEIGLIPEDYFLYFEETHWLLEASRKGYQCLILPKVRLAHHKRSEEDGLPAKYYFYYYIRNTLLFFARMTGEPAEAAMNRLVSGFVSNWLKKIEVRSPDSLETYTRISEHAIADGINGVSGRRDLTKLESDIFNLLPIPQNAEPFGSFNIDDQGCINGAISLKTPISGAATIHILEQGNVIEGIKCTSENNGMRFHCKTQLPPKLRAGRIVNLEFRLNGESVVNGHLSKLVSRATPSYKGRIDGISQYICSGWAWNKNDPQDQVTVEILHDDKVIGTAIADEYRADLLRHEIGNGKAAFAIRLPRKFSDGSKRLLQLRVVGETEILFERMVIDGAISGGAMPKPLEQSLDDLFYQRQLWIAKHDLSALSVGRYFKSMEMAMAKRHEKRAPNETVSIIMPCFNRRNIVRDAVESVIAQTYPNWELLVVDDGCSDGTAEFVETLAAELGEDRIRVIRLPKNRGVSAARNAGLRTAKGQWIAYLDSDNQWSPNFLTIMLGELVDDPDLATTAYCAQLIKQSTFASGIGHLVEDVALRGGPFDFPLLENRNYIDLNCYMHRADMFTKYGGFAEDLHRLVDWEFILRYSRIESPKYVPALLSHYFFDKADNQITKLVNYEKNLRLFNKIAECHLSRPDHVLPARPVDVLLVSAENIEPEALSKRVEDIAASFPSGADFRVLVPVAKNVAGSHIQCSALKEAPQGLGQILKWGLEERRADADLFIIQPSGLPEKGWLNDLNRAIQAAPKAGAFIPRHMKLTGKLRDVASDIPFAHNTRDVCVTLSAKSRLVINPDYNRKESLSELNGLGEFCFYLTRECAADLWVPTEFQLQPNALLSEIADQIRHAHRRQIIFCGRVSIYDLPVF